MELIENFKINCSQIGSLMGTSRINRPPTEKEIKKLLDILGRDYGELSEPMKHTAHEILTKAIDYEPNRPTGKIQSAMILFYAYAMYGKSKVSQGNDSPHQLEKGIAGEPEAIRFLSKLDGVEYEKNEELFSNKWFKGVPDILVEKEGGKVTKIIDVKVSYDLPSFIMSKIKNETSDNIYEMMGYMDLLGCKSGEIVHILVDMPDKIANFEEKRLRDRYKFLELDEDVITDRIGRVMNNMEYSCIPDELKYFRHPVTLNKLTMKAVKSRVTISKKWMKDIHTIFSQNLVTLPEITSDKQEDSI